MKKHDRESIKQFYNIDAFSYKQNRWNKDDVSKANYEMTRDSLLETLHPGPDDRILEVGCGAGTWTKLVSDMCSQLVAIDISENMIAEARASVGNNSVEFILDDFVDHDLEGKFDKVFSVRVLEHFDQKEKVLKKIYDALNPQGSFVVITKTVPSIWNGRGKVNSLFKRRGSSKNARPKHEESFWIIRISPWRLAAMMKSAGFSRIEIYPVILRPPIFKNGENEYPILSPPRDRQILSRFVNLSKHARNAPNPVRIFSTLFTESYLIRGVKE